MFFGRSKRRQEKSKRLPTKKLAFESLESRWLLANYVVTNSNDSGDDSLRSAILLANANTNEEHTIKIAKGLGNEIIMLQTPLPVITEPVRITAKDFTWGLGVDRDILITINGSQLNSQVVVQSGLEFYIDDGTTLDTIITIEGLGITNFPGPGIRISDLPTNYDLNVRYNLIDSNNRIHTGGGGIHIDLPGTDTFNRYTIANNEIISNYHGIYADVDAQVRISSNLIGTDGSSTIIGNLSDYANYGHGIFLANSSTGELSNVSYNTVSGNVGHGIYLQDSIFSDLGGVWKRNRSQ